MKADFAISFRYFKPATLVSRCKDTKYILNLQFLETLIRIFNFNWLNKFFNCSATLTNLAYMAFYELFKFAITTKYFIKPFFKVV